MDVIFTGSEVSNVPDFNAPVADLQLLNISKSFGLEWVLENVSLEVRRGQIVGLLGHNGSGKSTLLNIAGGSVRPDSGSIQLKGSPADFRSVAQARRAGIILMSQAGATFPDLSVLENIFAGSEPAFRILGVRLLRKRAMLAEVRALHERLALQSLPLDRSVSTLSQGQRFLVGFMRVFRLQPLVLALDEPTATLGYRERTAVNAVIRDLAESGCGVILVSHILEDVLALAHHIVVLRRGRVVYSRPTSDSDRSEIVEALVL